MCSIHTPRITEQETKNKIPSAALRTYRQPGLVATCSSWCYRLRVLVRSPVDLPQMLTVTTHVFSLTVRASTHTYGLDHRPMSRPNELDDTEEFGYEQSSTPADPAGQLHARPRRNPCIRRVGSRLDGVKLFQEWKLELGRERHGDLQRDATNTEPETEWAVHSAVRILYT